MLIFYIGEFLKEDWLMETENVVTGWGDGSLDKVLLFKPEDMSSESHIHTDVKGEWISAPGEWRQRSKLD